MQKVMSIKGKFCDIFQKALFSLVLLVTHVLTCANSATGIYENPTKNQYYTYEKIGYWIIIIHVIYPGYIINNIAVDHVHISTHHERGHLA